MAYYLFIASLAGVVVQMIHNLAIADSTAVYGPGEVSMVILIPAVAAFLIWYSRFSQSRGWIK